MSSLGQALGGLVGGAIGFFVGGPSGALYGAQIGMTAGGLLDPPKVQGPRLQDLNLQTSTYGAFIPRIYGAVALTGNVFWIQGDKLIEHSHTEGGKGGPEVTTFEYYASFAVGLCEGPIEGIRRIWIAGQLWYDAGSDDLATIISSNQAASKFTVYLGDDTQAADPLIQADRGAANVPAYRGLAYIVFTELPLKNYGNSLAGAQIKVEVAKDVTTSISPIKLHERYLPGGPTPMHSPVYNHPLTKDPGGKPLFIGHARASGDSVADIVFQPFATYADYLAPTVVTYDASWDRMPYPNYCETDAATFRLGSTSLNKIEVDGVIYESGLTLTSTEYEGRMLETTAHIFYFLRKFSGSSSWLSIINKGGNFQTIFQYAISLDYMPGMAYDADNDQVVLLWRDKIEKYSNDTATLDATVNFTLDTTPIGGVSIDGGNIWIVTANTGGTDMLIGRSLVDGSIAHNWSWSSSGAGLISGYVHDGILYYTKNVGTGATDRRLYIYQLPGRISLGSAMLGDIVQSECLQSALLTAADIDVTDLSDGVRGYRISNLGAIRGGIDALRKAWLFDVVQHGYKIKFKARGGASVATITQSELDARAAGDKPGVQINNSREMDTVIPDHLLINYIDAAREYDQNTAEETR